MKILDSKGRLFGRINIVDILIVALFIVSIPVFLCAYSILEKSPERIAAKKIRVEAIAFVIPEIAEKFKPGDVSYDEFGTINGRLVRVMANNSAYAKKMKYVFAYKTSYLIAKNRYIIPVILDLELLCTKSGAGERWYFRRQPLIMSLDYGDKFMFDSRNYRIYCCPLKICED